MASGAFAQTNTCGTSLGAGANCTIAVTFTPTASGSLTGSITITDNASGSPQTVSLTGTGAAIALSPASLTFSGVAVGATSAAQAVTLQNGGSTALTISGITPTTNFGEANTCGSSLAAGASCTISVTFSPTASGSVTGTLTVTDNAGGTAGSTQTVSLSGSTNLTNTVAVTVGFGPNGQSGGYYDGVFTTVTVCQPGSTTCVTVPNVLVDTGSVGLRVLSSRLSGVTLTQVNDGNGNYLAECTTYGDGSFNWGTVSWATVQIGGETASQAPGGTANSGVPIQVIVPQAVPASVTATGQCVNSTSTPDENTVQTLGANGILGIAAEPTDCSYAGTNYCDTTEGLSSLSAEPYFICPVSGSCSTDVVVPQLYQVWNPVSAFSSADTNGVLLQLPSVPAAGQATAAGTLTFGIGTESNNAITTQTIFEQDTSGNLGSLVFNGVTYTTSNSNGSFLDSGSNAYYVSDPSTLSTATGITTAACSDNGYYCPASTLNLNLTLGGSQANATTAPETISIENADSLLSADATTQFAVFNDLGVPSGGTDPTTDAWDLGLPFFLGRSIFVGIAGTNTAYPNGYWAF
jgi:hypothetical protein